MRFEIDDDGRTADQAAQWIGAMLHKSERREEFFAWVAKSPQHVQELTYMLADLRDIACLQPDDLERIERLAHELGTDEGESDSTVIPISPSALVPSQETGQAQLPTLKNAATPGNVPPEAPADTSSASRWASVQRKRRTMRLLWLNGIAAAFAMAAIGAWWVTGPGSWRTYSTNVGDQMAIDLADGSTVHLNTDSEIAVRLSDATRSIRLKRGEALFTVAHDAKRPFLVDSNGALIRAIGTRFDVYRRAQNTRVAVVEGLVQISARGGTFTTSSEALSSAQTKRIDEARVDQTRSDTKPLSVQLLAAGQVADVSSQGEVSRRDSVDAGKTVAWRQRRLVFENETLANIAAEFNRYNTRLKIRIAGNAASQERFTATFDANAPEALIQALGDDPMLMAERVGSEIVIHERGSQGN